MSRHQRRRDASIERKRTGYMHRLRAAYANGGIMVEPGLYHAVVQHDAWCGIYQGRGCNCVPDISVTGADTVTVIDENGDGTKVKRS